VAGLRWGGAEHLLTAAWPIMVLVPTFSRVIHTPATITLQPCEPAVAAWGITTPDELLQRIRILTGTPQRRPAVVAVDGRSGSGKTTLATRLQALEQGAAILHVDDLSWNEPLCGWDEVLRQALRQLQGTGELDFTPPAWQRHGRAGSLRIPAGTPMVIVEGTGSGMRAVADLVDAHLWVQTDENTAEERGIGRDIRAGTNGNEVESIAFWKAWMRAERPFFAADKPWERADMIVSGEAFPELTEGEIAWVDGPLSGPRE